MNILLAKSGSAWTEPATRRPIHLDVGRAFGMLLAAFALAFAGGPFLDDEGDARAGVPEFVPFLLIGPALLAARPGRGGVVTTEDGRSIAWAGRSPSPWWLLRKKARRGN
ncbi:MAG: hypothetical protein J7518_20495 [Nocardioidaceae bacterium]|nr:hypothetical protein [Nocardioidaceae bacterium]